MEFVSLLINVLGGVIKFVIKSVKRVYISIFLFYFLKQFFVCLIMEIKLFPFCIILDELKKIQGV